jgi:hypothetical protein
LADGSLILATFSTAGAVAQPAIINDAATAATNFIFMNNPPFRRSSPPAPLAALEKWRFIYRPELISRISKLG